MQLDHSLGGVRLLASSKKMTVQLGSWSDRVLLNLTTGSWFPLSSQLALRMGASSGCLSLFKYFIFGRENIKIFLTCDSVCVCVCVYMLNDTMTLWVRKFWYLLSYFPTLNPAAAVWVQGHADTHIHTTHTPTHTDRQSWQTPINCGNQIIN